MRTLSCHSYDNSIMYSGILLFLIILILLLVLQGEEIMWHNEATLPSPGNFLQLFLWFPRYQQALPTHF